MKKRIALLPMLVMWIFGFAVAMLCCCLILTSKFGTTEILPYAAKFATIYKIIDDNYIGEPDMELAADYAYTAMVASVGDRWSRYMTAEEYESYVLFQQNSYKGIGITLKSGGADGEYAQVAEMTEDSPAQSAGLEIGDYMLEIDGVDLMGKSASEIRKLIEERTDTDFSLRVLRGEQELELKITPGIIPSNPVKYEMLDNNIGYIRIKNFEQRSAENTIKAIDELKAEGAKALVFDVRSNPGGLLNELVSVLDHLLPEGDIFVSANKAGEESVIRSDAEFVDLPIAVLIDGRTYSAAEFFAAALSEYDRAVLVGEATTGKSRTQVNIPLEDGSAVHISVNRYLTPKRVDLSESGGLVPEIEASVDEELLPLLSAGVLLHDEDEVLKAGIKALSEN